MPDGFFIDARGQLIRRPANPNIPPTVVDTTIKSFNLSQSEVMAILALPITDPTRIALLASGTIVSPGLSTAVPAIGYAMAVRASQASNQLLIDQGPARNAFLRNDGILPVAFAPSSPVALGAYRTPSTPNGLVYKCTTAGTTGSAEPTWNTTIGGTTAAGSGGTAVFTTEKGPYFIGGDGARLFRSLASSQVGQAAVHQLATLTPWDMSQGDSFILNLRPKFDWNGSGQAAASPVFSTSLNGTGPGIRLLATGSVVNDVRIQIRTAGGDVLSGNLSAGLPQKPFDGAERNITLMVDGPTKIAYLYIDGLPIRQADMLDGNQLCPNGMNLATLVGSTAGSFATIGGDPGAATSYEVAFKSVDFIVLPRQGLPANILAVAQSFARGGEALLSQAVVQ